MRVEYVEATYGSGCAPDLIISAADFMKTSDNDKEFNLAEHAINLFMANQDVKWRFDHHTAYFLRRQIKENGNSGNLLFAIIDDDDYKHLEVYLIQQNKPSRLQLAIDFWEG